MQRNTEQNNIGANTAKVQRAVNNPDRTAASSFSKPADASAMRANMQNPGGLEYEVAGQTMGGALNYDNTKPGSAIADTKKLVSSDKSKYVEQQTVRPPAQQSNTHKSKVKKNILNTAACDCYFPVAINKNYFILTSFV